jgi:uncharacterized protein YacL
VPLLELDGDQGAGARVWATRLFRRIVVVFSVISVVVVFSVGGVIVVIIIALLALLALVCFLLRVFRLFLRVFRLFLLVFRLFLLVFRRCRSHLCLRRRRARRQTSRDARALPAATVTQSTGVRQPLGAVTRRQNLPRRNKGTISLAT